MVNVGSYHFCARLATDHPDLFRSVVKEAVEKDPEIIVHFVHDMCVKDSQFEPYILKNADATFEYMKKFGFGLWPEAEEIISSDGRLSYQYFARLDDMARASVSKKILDAIEKKLLALKRSDKILEYATMIGGRLPDSLHNRLIMEGNRNYVHMLETWNNNLKKYIRTLSEEERNDLVKG